MKMRTLSTLFITLLSATLLAQDCNIGNSVTSSDFTTGNFQVNYLLGVNFTLDQEGTLNAINMIGNGTGDSYQMAVYDDLAGVPNNLIAASALGIVGSGINSLPVSPTLLSPGDYWVMAIYETGGDNSNVNVAASDSHVFYQTLAFGAPIPSNASNFLNYFGQDFLYFLDITCGDALSVTAIDEPITLRLFPNPVHDLLQVTGLDRTVHYEIFDVLGASVLEGRVSDAELIKVQDLSDGIYQISFDHGYAMKFIRE